MIRMELRKQVAMTRTRKNLTTTRRKLTMTRIRKKLAMTLIRGKTLIKTHERKTKKMRKRKLKILNKTEMTNHQYPNQDRPQREKKKVMVSWMIHGVDLPVRDLQGLRDHLVEEVPKAQLVKKVKTQNHLRGLWPPKAQKVLVNLPRENLLAQKSRSLLNHAVLIVILVTKAQ